MHEMQVVCDGLSELVQDHLTDQLSLVNGLAGYWLAIHHVLREVHCSESSFTKNLKATPSLINFPAQMEKIRRRPNPKHRLQFTRNA